MRYLQFNNIKANSQLQMVAIHDTNQNNVIISIFKNHSLIKLLHMPDASIADNYIHSFRDGKKTKIYLYPTGELNSEFIYSVLLQNVVDVYELYNFYIQFKHTQ